MPPEIVLSSLFGVSVAEVTDATSSATVAEWDSLGHMTLIVELESVYGVHFSAEETLRMTDVASIKRVLESRGVAW